MIFRFVPRMKQEFRSILSAQRSMHCLSGIRLYSRTFMALFSWCFESSVQTSESMQSRGYGEKGRTSYNNYRFTARDIVMLCVIALLTATVIAGFVTDKISFVFYPSVATEVSFFSYVCYGCYAVLCALPFAVNMCEERKWKYLK